MPEVYAPHGTAYTLYTAGQTATAWMGANPGWTLGPITSINPLAGRFNGGIVTLDGVAAGGVLAVPIAICAFRLGFAQGTVGFNNSSSSLVVQWGDATGSTYEERQKLFMATLPLTKPHHRRRPSTAVVGQSGSG